MNINLLVPINKDTVSESINDFTLTNKPLNSALKYYCVSYSWGSQTVNPRNESQMISSRLDSVFNTVLKVNRDVLEKGELEIQKVWVDSLCSPNLITDSELLGLGEIYNKAVFVIVVLSEAMSPILSKIIKEEKFINEDLELLAKEDWISRPWTYQECLNSKHIYFIAENNYNNCVKGSYFLDIISTESEKFSIELSLDTFEFHKKYNKLVSWESLNAPWRDEVLKRKNAYQTMVAIYLRGIIKGDNLILTESILGDNSFEKLALSMIGTFGVLNKKHNDLPIHEKFMKICETKNDFSYIFCEGPRSLKSNESWRPSSMQFKPVFLWLYSYGEGQKGNLTKEYLKLENVILMKQAEISDKSIEALSYLFSIDNITKNLSCSLNFIYERHKIIGFNGTNDYLQLEWGYFFPMNPIDFSKNIYIIVPKDFGWSFGSPGLVVEKTGDLYKYLDLGIFTGERRNAPGQNIKII